ncbi:MAG: hypothetical protein WCL23_04930 [Candidatus Moraniibacteriota bacterium]
MSTRKLIIASSLRNYQNEARIAINRLATEVSGRLADMGYEVILCLTDDASDDDTYGVLKGALETFPGEVKLFRSNPRKFRGPAFVIGLEYALSALTESEYHDSVIILCDLCAKAPHDPHEFPHLLRSVEFFDAREKMIVVGSTYYGGLTNDDFELQGMGALQFYEAAKFSGISSKGEPCNIQSPGLLAATADLFAKAIKNYRIFDKNFENFAKDPARPGPGTPGIILMMLAIAGGGVYGHTLPVPPYGDWRPCRSWDELMPHMQGTLKYLGVIKAMFRAGLFK